MRKIIVGSILIVVIVCFAQDAQVSWDGFFIDDNNTRWKDPETITVLDFPQYCIIDKISENCYFFYRRSNFRHDGRITGGGGWGIMEIRGNELYENIFSWDFNYAFTITKPGQEFEFSAVCGPGETQFVYSKLQFYPQEE